MENNIVGSMLVEINSHSALIIISIIFFIIDNEENVLTIRLIQPDELIKWFLKLDIPYEGKKDFLK